MTTEELNALKDRAYKTAVAHGFHEEVKSDAYYLGLVMSEMGKAINKDRKVMHAYTKGFEANMARGYLTPCILFEEYIKNSVEDDLADMVIQLLDFAGMKGYKLRTTAVSGMPSKAIIEEYANNGLSGSLFYLNGALSDALDDGVLGLCVGIVINVISDCFKKFTGSDRDLWWFVEQKMKYNELRPRLNGKRYQSQARHRNGERPN